MHLLVDGDGPPVVLNHGFADDCGTFDAQLPALAGRRVCRWDLPGHGRSMAGGGPATRETALHWLDAAIAAAGSGPAVLVGHSLGGYLSLCRTVLDPAAVAGLVLVSTGPGFRDPVKRERWNRFLASYADRHGIEPSVRRLAQQPDSLVLDGLAAIEVPVVVVVGADDEQYHAGSRAVVESVRRGRLVVIDCAGHFPHRSHADEVNRHLVEHLMLVAAG